MQILEIMVPKHKEQGLVQARDNELIIFERKIACRNHNIDICISAGNILGVYQWVCLI
jgi:hypothetical protein